MKSTPDLFPVSIISSKSEQVNVAGLLNSTSGRHPSHFRDIVTRLDQSARSDTVPSRMDSSIYSGHIRRCDQKMEERTQERMELEKLMSI